MKNNNFTELKQNDIVKTKTGYYYTVLRKGKYLTTFKRIDKTGIMTLNLEEINKMIETIYNTEDEKNIIRNRIREEKLKKMNIDIEKFSTLTREERYKTIEDKKDIPVIEKIDLYEYTPVKINREKLSVMLEKATQKHIKALKNLDNNNNQMKKSCDEIKSCCFCKKIEGEMIQGKNGYYAHSICLEKARKRLL